MAGKNPQQAVAPAAPATRYAPKHPPPPGMSIDDLPPEIIAGVGELVMWWSYVQFQLGVIAREAVRISPAAGFMLTYTASYQPLQRILSNIVDSGDHWIREKAIRDDVSDLLKKLNRKENKNIRNDYAHGIFGFVDALQKQPARFLFSTAEQKLQPDTEAITVASLREKANIARELWDQAQRITHMLKTSNRKRP